ncbi:MAG: hypothetical protein IPJ65_05980 [Archangiaceae bacterium]|nr:hypothetical protein [Archangiaceae bacterium]
MTRIKTSSELNAKLVKAITNPEFRAKVDAALTQVADAAATAVTTGIEQDITDRKMPYGDVRRHETQSYLRFSSKEGVTDTTYKLAREVDISAALRGGEVTSELLSDDRIDFAALSRQAITKKLESLGFEVVELKPHRHSVVVRSPEFVKDAKKQMSVLQRLFLDLDVVKKSRRERVIG